MHINSTFNGKTLAQIQNMDSASFSQFAAEMDSGRTMTREQFAKYIDTTFSSGLHFGNNYKSRKDYDSLLASGKINNGWLVRQFIYKQIEINDKYNHSTQQISDAFSHALIHSIPQMLFISLPILALLLKLLYIRRKQFYYVSHGIFAIHLYIFVFISLLVIFALSRINSQVNWSVFGFLSALLIFGLFVYEYMALKNFYRQGWIKTFIKFLLLNILFLIVLTLIFVIFIFFSFFNI
jgi:hypothetical protein